jgi:hypothetical protein
LVNIMSILVKDTSNDVRVWLEGALAELSQIDDCAAAIVDMSGITLMAQFISASTDGQASAASPLSPHLTLATLFATSPAIPNHVSPDPALT